MCGRFYSGWQCEKKGAQELLLTPGQPAQRLDTRETGVCLFPLPHLVQMGGVCACPEADPAWCPETLRPGLGVMVNSL